MRPPPEVPEITPIELKERLDHGDVPILVDVREPFEVAIADLPEHDQHRIPTGEFPLRFAELSPKDEIVVYCRSGSRSAWAGAQRRCAAWSNTTAAFRSAGATRCWTDSGTTLTAPCC